MALVHRFDSGALTSGKVPPRKEAMTVTVVKTITENTNGRKEDPTSPTGWMRRAGVEWEEYVDERGKTKKHSKAIWEPCEGPTTYVYGSDAHRQANEERRGGGTVSLEIEGLEGGLYNLTADEAETLLRLHAHNYSDGMAILHGTLFIGGSKNEMTPPQGLACANEARARVLELFGLDLSTTNVFVERT